MSRANDASSPFIWPPVIYGVSTIFGAVTSWYFPWPFEPPAHRQAVLAAGIMIFVIGGLIALAAEWQFKTSGTAILPTRPTTTIVSHGIYGVTRNPMYLGMSLALVGLGLGFDQLWFLLALPLAKIAVTKLAIEREEAYLAAKFGADYLAYKARVRRWI